MNGSDRAVTVRSTRRITQRVEQKVRPLSGERVREKRQTCPMGVFRLNGRHLSKDSNGPERAMSKEAILKYPSADSFAAELVISPNEKRRSDALTHPILGKHLDAKQDTNTAAPCAGQVGKRGLVGSHLHTNGMPCVRVSASGVGDGAHNSTGFGVKRYDLPHRGQRLREEDERFAFLLNHASVKRVEGQKVVFAELPELPGVLVVYRSPEERERSAERLNLDRRRLTHCPLLEGEEKLRLLNFQNNSITSIDNLSSLPNLIFLDLYANAVTEIKNLQAVPLLRVLMMGKNQVSKIENLESNPRLDVLDLHLNRIEKVENLEPLTQLRVLNLAGNMIRNFDFAADLPSSLTELNLRRNLISHVERMDTLHNLQRLFLSHNRISEYNDIEGIFERDTLTELSLDGNPISNDLGYRDHIFSRCKSRLRHFDMKKVPDEERLALSGYLPAAQGATPGVRSPSRSPFLESSTPYSSPEGQKLRDKERSPSKRDSGILNAWPLCKSPSRCQRKEVDEGSEISVWSLCKSPSRSQRKEIEEGDEKPMAVNMVDDRPASVSTCSSSRHFRKKEDGSANAGALQCDAAHLAAEACHKEEGKGVTKAERRAEKGEKRTSPTNAAKQKKENVPSRQDVLHEIRTQWEQAVAENRAPTTRFGYVKREEVFELFIFGRGLDALDKSEYQTSVSSIHFLYLTLELILQRQHSLMKFTNLECVTLGHNLIYSLSQLSTFKQLCTLKSLHIMANPVCSDGTLRIRMINAYPNLTVVNDRPVTVHERHWVTNLMEPLMEARANEVPWASEEASSSTPQMVDAAVDELLTHAQTVEKKVAVVRDNFDTCLKDRFCQIWDNDVAKDF